MLADAPLSQKADAPLQRVPSTLLQLADVGHIVQRLADCLLAQGSGELVARVSQVPILEIVEEVNFAFGECERA